MGGIGIGIVIGNWDWAKSTDNGKITKAQR
jgi:hypothetical protein